MSNRFTLKVAVHLLLRKGNEILLLRRYNTGYEDGNYSLIAGHVDGNESVSHAMIREAYEEAGIKIELNNLKTVHVMHRKKTNGEYIEYFFECVNWENEAVNMEPHKCDELKWFDINNIPLNTVNYINKAINEYINNSYFSEFGW